MSATLQLKRFGSLTVMVERRGRPPGLDSGVSVDEKEALVTGQPGGGDEGGGDDGGGDEGGGDEGGGDEGGGDEGGLLGPGPKGPEDGPNGPEEGPKGPEDGPKGPDEAAVVTPPPGAVGLSPHAT
jgi:hypothetical protein